MRSGNPSNFRPYFFKSFFFPLSHTLLTHSISFWKTNKNVESAFPKERILPFLKSLSFLTLCYIVLLSDIKMVEKEIKHIITSKLKHCVNYVEIIIFYVECLHHKSEVQGHAKLWKLFKCFNPKSFIRLKCTWNFPTHFTYGSRYFSSGITITEIHILGKLLFCNILNWIWSLILQNVIT